MAIENGNNMNARPTVRPFVLIIMVLASAAATTIGGVKGNNDAIQIDVCVYNSYRKT